jgi:hypothetical protein
MKMTLMCSCARLATTPGARVRVPGRQQTTAEAHRSSLLKKYTTRRRTASHTGCPPAAPATT